MMKVSPKSVYEGFRLLKVFEQRICTGMDSTTKLQRNNGFLNDFRSYMFSIGDWAHIYRNTEFEKQNLFVDCM